VVGVLLCDVLQCEVVLYWTGRDVGVHIGKTFEAPDLVGWNGFGWKTLGVSMVGVSFGLDSKQCIAGIVACVGIMMGVSMPLWNFVNVSLYDQAIYCNREIRLIWICLALYFCSSHWCSSCYHFV
jgi:hypothetical protein